MPCGRRLWTFLWCGASLVFLAGAADARAQEAQIPPDGAVGPQMPAPVERLGFEAAIARAIERNRSSAVAAAGILRADALLAQVQAGNRLQINGSVTTTTLNRGVSFEGVTVVPQSQVASAIDARFPIFAPAAWARRAQAGDGRDIAELSAADTRRQTAIAAADAYLAIVARRRVVEANVRARDTARAHFELARELEQLGAGSRLNLLRAQQELSIDEGLVETAQLAVYQAQEALGVLLMAGGSVDAAEDPQFALPEAELSAAAPVAPGGGLLLNRPDLRLFTAQRQAAGRVVSDSRKDAFPRLDAILQGQNLYPSQAFAQANTARFLLQLSVPMFDSGGRNAQRAERQALLTITAANLAAASVQATSEVRSARAAVGSTGRALTNARAAAEQAQQVVEIVNVSFRAGAATNIEVIDAERRGRDADTAVAVAEDAVRRARLDLRAALGLFP